MADIVKIKVKIYKNKYLHKCDLLKVQRGGGMENSYKVENDRPIKRPYSSDRVIVRSDRVYKIDDKPIQRGKVYHYDFDDSYVTGEGNNGKRSTGFDINEINAKIRSMPKKTKVRLATAVGVICLIGIGAGTISSVASPSAVAKKFVVASYNGDFDKVYSCLYLPESPFLKKENFDAKENANEKNEKKIKNVKLISKEDIGTDSKEFYFEYDGNEKGMYTDVTLRKTGERVIGVFPEWKVYSENYVAYGAKLTAPNNYNLSIDGIAPTDENAKIFDNEEDGTKTYRVDVFSGSNVIDASAEYMKSDSFKYYLSSNKEIKIDNLELDDNIKKTVVDQFEKFIPFVYGEIANRRNADGLKTYIGNEYLNDVNREYSSTYNSINSNSRYRITGISLNNFETEVDRTYVYEGKFYVELKMSFRYKVNSSYTSIFGRNRTTSNTSRAVVYGTYVKENEQWKIADLDLKKLYT